MGSKKSNEQLHLIYIFGWLVHFITYERKYIFFKFIYYFRFIFRLYIFLFLLLCIVFGWIISYLWYVIIGVMIILFNSLIRSLNLMDSCFVRQIFDFDRDAR